PFLPISASDSKFNPQNTPCIPAVKFFIFLELSKKFSFSANHYLAAERKRHFCPFPQASKY
ncbi:MAG: hypothetical protein RBR08_14590, partial [Desulforegulaceae bacterium]|nr:hypothetical protein [Desulforegulaceae bacterium]